MSLFARSYNKVYVLTVALVLWSGMTAVTGLSTTFWEVAVSRVGQAVGEAACTPFAAGIIASYFPTHLKATALSLYNVGVYAGTRSPLCCTPCVVPNNSVSAYKQAVGTLYA